MTGGEKGLGREAGGTVSREQVPGDNDTQASVEGIATANVNGRRRGW